MIYKKINGVIKDEKGRIFCEHGRQKSFCKECGGHFICGHGRQRYSCIKCNGCEHGHTRRYCVECGGKAICEHKCRRYVCKKCGGKGICEHKRIRECCKECGGYIMWATMLERCAKRRAKKNNLPYDIPRNWIVEQLEKGCPIFKVPFEISDGRPGPHSASLDKFTPHLGYVMGNVYVISHLANLIKTYATTEQVLKVAKWMQRVTKETKC